MLVRAAALLSLCVCAEAISVPLQRPGGTALQPQPIRRTSAVCMGRKFENNKLKMAKTALAYAKKASYIGKKVVMAVKAAGDDPVTNRALGAVIREANALDVPKDVVERNIKKAMDPVTADYKELTYEAYGHGGVGLIINALSDNNNRANSEIGTVIKKSKCNMASSGGVAFNFERRGRLPRTREMAEEELIDLAIEAECEGDVTLEAPDPDGRGDRDDVKCVVMTAATELGAMQAQLQALEIECSGMLVYVPLATVACDAEAEEANFEAIDKLEELEDVVSVEHNMAVPV